MDLQKCALGIEFGSTRIKAVLIDENHNPVATGAYNWQNTLQDGVWIYPMEDAITGLRTCYRDLCRDVQEKYGKTIETLAAIGISGMMHG